MIRTLRVITVIGNSIGVTLPRHLLRTRGLRRGTLVEVLPASAGLLVRPARIVSADRRQFDKRAVLDELKTGLTHIYGVRLRGVYLYGSAARDVRQFALDIRVLVALDSVRDYGVEIQRTGGLISRLSLQHVVSISRIFASARDWQKRRRDEIVPL
ncbi:MAG: AbrB/MazE/SpoVT family DNA-binding domain-containing protein [bacterium]